MASSGLLPENTMPNPKPAIFWFGLVVIILFGTLVRINLARKHNSTGGDEGPWLRLASQVGTAAFMTNRVIEHDYFKTPPVLPRPEDNRSPAFPVIIAMFKWVNADLYRAGQTANIVTYVIMSLALGWLVMATLGGFVSLFFILYFGCSPHFITYTTNIYPDILVASLFFIFISKAGSILATWKSAVFSGFALGLLYLLKSTAVFIIPVAVFQFLPHWKNAGKQRNLLLFLGIFFLTVFPWLLRNFHHFGSPTFQLVNLTLYMENMHDVFLTGMDIPTLSSYLAEKGPFFVFIMRPLLGVVEIVKMLIFDDNHLSAAVLPFSIIGIWAGFIRKQKGWRPHAVFALFYLPVMAYIAYNSFITRYLEIIYLWLYLTGIIGAFTIAARFKKGLQANTVAAVLATTPLLLTCTYPLEFFLSERGQSLERGVFAREAVRYTASVLPAREAVLSPFASGFSYMHDMNCINMLRFQNARDLERIVQQYSVSYALLDSSAFEVLLPLFMDTENGLLLETEKPFGPFTLYRISARSQDEEPPESSPL